MYCSPVCTSITNQTPSYLFSQAERMAAVQFTFAIVNLEEHADGLVIIRSNWISKEAPNYCFYPTKVKDMTKFLQRRDNVKPTEDWSAEKIRLFQDHIPTYKEAFTRMLYFMEHSGESAASEAEAGGRRKRTITAPARFDSSDDENSQPTRKQAKKPSQKKGSSQPIISEPARTALPPFPQPPRKPLTPRVVDTNYMRELLITPEAWRDTYEDVEDSQDIGTYFAGGEDLHSRNEEDRQAHFDSDIDISALNVEIPLTPPPQAEIAAPSNSIPLTLPPQAQNAPPSNSIPPNPQAQNAPPSNSQQEVVNNPPGEELEELRNLTTQELLLKLYGEIKSGFHAFGNRLSNLEKDVAYLKATAKSGGLIGQSANKAPIISLANLYPAGLPCKSSVEVEALENFLNENADTRKKFFQGLLQLGGAKPGDIIREVLRTLLSNRAAKEYSYQGEGSNNKAFQTLLIHDMALHAVRANPQFHDYTASSFKEVVENWLRNASKRLLAEGKKVPRGPQRVPDYV
nr:PREDICTED: uncharacterized protein LOC109037206 isoform X2 [Bemisia tabaci]